MPTPQTAKLQEQPPAQAAPPAADGRAAGAPVSPLTTADAPEVLAFLAGGSVDSIFMSGLVRDNGVESPLNRGTFCAVRAATGELEGVALVGHATLVEARTERALRAFAAFAKRCHTAHFILGEQEKAERFWGHYREGGQELSRLCRELLFELRWPVPADAPVEGLRRATEADLELILEVNALMAEEESGVDPRASDPEGFRRRTLRRVEQGRAWVLTEGGRLVFKAELLAETPEFAYLEGVYVDPRERRRGVGRRCLSQLGRTLLERAGAVCLLVNEQNRGAQSFFLKAGYRQRGCYDTIYLKRA